MTPDDIQRDMTCRQRALWCLLAALCILFGYWLFHMLWPTLPTPFALKFFPVVPALLIALSAWLYPRRGLTERRNKSLERLRVVGFLVLTLSPFATFSTLYPESGYFGFCAYFFSLCGALYLTRYARFLADAAPSLARRRLLANYIFFSSIICVCVPTIFFALRFLPLKNFGQHAWVELAASFPYILILAHPLFLFAGLLALWPTDKDGDFPLMLQNKDAERAE